MRVSYKWKSAGKCKHWGGSIIRLQIHKCFRSTSVDCEVWETVKMNWTV